ncbi:DUF6602 domain-containing protein [Flavobacterium chungangense]|uniref:DUF6602 domain-containing protein n=1 Tax=Flavobacterium chungangense TaxID=554283 RepID=A0A6V6YXU0_9FLAO|nr:DUF6602 domain-containing protein [Flavobacterium chungangense]CAD0004311.1 hypothetical protein FLACHUCJ7_01810 [Flavobacterium chungangense]
MENFYGQHGWQEFNRNRKDILVEFDRILELIKSRPVKTAHGNGVEAYLRKWLAEFLPKKYGVTSGYIIPDLYDNNIKLFHYDVIIFNQLDSPVLWTEGNEDQSEQGKFRAVPAKYVMAVYEVKSRLNVASVTDALNKLREANDFKEQLHPLYSCGVIFIDLKDSENNNESIIKGLIKGKDVFGFNGGMVLRYEGDESCIGSIRLFDVDEGYKDNYERYIPIAKNIDDLNIYISEEGNLTLGEQGGGIKIFKNNDEWLVSKSYSVDFSEENKRVHLSWSRSHFAEFCIDLLSTLEGLAFNDERRPRFGRIFDHVELKKTPQQSSTFEKGKAFLVVKLLEQSEISTNESEDFEISYKVSIENKGDLEVIFSDDLFKSKCTLPVGETAVKLFEYKTTFGEKIKKASKLLKKNPVIIPYRIAYYPSNTDKEFCLVEKKIKITDKGIMILDNEST